MTSPKTPKPATALHGEPASNVIGFRGLNAEIKDSKTPTDIQVRRLCRLFVMSQATAVAVAELAFAGGQR